MLRPLETSGAILSLRLTNILTCSTVTSMEKALPHLNNIQELLKNAIFLQQQLKYEQSRRPKKDPGSLYQRFSAHLTSVDLPELGDTRAESVISRETAGSEAASGGGARSAL